jgi:hypothetical protein
LNGSLGLCSRHKLQKWRAENPIRAAYLDHKSNSKRRNIFTDLTLLQFTDLCYQTKYHIGKGKTKNSLTLDRIDESKGYTVDNIQVMENGDNVRKSLNYRFDRRGYPCDFHVITFRPAQTNTAPF